MDYVGKGIVKEFGGSSKVSIKIKDSIYVFEANMVKYLPESVDPSEVDIAQEYKLLYDELNAEVDEQIREVEDSYYAQR